MRTITRRGFRRIFCLLFLVAVVVAAVGAFASPRANQGSMRLSNALPANIIVVTNTNDSGPGSLRDALAIANDGDTIDATGVSGTILLTSGELQITSTKMSPSAAPVRTSGSGRQRAKSRVLRQSRQHRHHFRPNDYKWQQRAFITMAAR